MIENIQQLSMKDRKHTTVVLGKVENIQQLSKKDRKHTTAV